MLKEKTIVPMKIAMKGSLSESCFCCQIELVSIFWDPSFCVLPIGGVILTYKMLRSAYLLQVIENDLPFAYLFLFRRRRVRV